MIIELGHFAVVLALAVAALQMALPAWGAHTGDRRLMQVAEPAALAQARPHRDRLPRAYLGLRHLRLLGRERRRQLALRQAPALQDLRCVGEPRGLHAPVGPHPRPVRRCRRLLRRQPARHPARQRARGPGRHRRRFPRLHRVRLQPIHTGSAAAPGARPQPGPAGPGAGLPPALPLRGLRRPLGGVRLRRCRAHRGPHGCGLGALGAPLDAGGLGVPHARHRHGLLVGLLRAGLGRLVVLGPGRERLLHALARRHRAAPLRPRHGEA